MKMKSEPAPRFETAAGAGPNHGTTPVSDDLPKNGRDMSPDQLPVQQAVRTAEEINSESSSSSGSISSPFNVE